MLSRIALADGVSKAASLDLGDRAEQPGAEAERVGVLGGGAAVVVEPDAADERLGARVLDQVVEIDLDGLGARALLQQHVAALHEAEAVALRACRAAAAHVERGARREQRAGQVLRLVSEVRDEVPHDAIRSIRTPA